MLGVVGVLLDLQPTFSSERSTRKECRELPGAERRHLGA